MSLPTSDHLQKVLSRKQESRESSEDPENEESPLRSFQSSLSRFSFNDPGNKKSPTKTASTSNSPSSRNYSSQLDVSPTRMNSCGNDKRPRVEDDGHGHTVKLESSPSPSKKAKGKKAARGYAAPEVYAHLNPLNDCLLESLDIVFCGINPGRRSAELGHHFAHPSNHFWKCLHLSGLTPERIPPEKDFTLPECYRLGLTNIVDRPTAEATELKDSEFKEGVAPFLSKIARYRPRIACFIGLRTGRIVLDQVMRVRPQANKPLFSVGLQPYKIVYSETQGGISESRQNDQGISDVSETLFYAVPSTSGKVQGYQIPDKVKLLSQLKTDLEKLKDGNLLTTDFMEITC